MIIFHVCEPSLSKSRTFFASKKRGITQTISYSYVNFIRTFNERFSSDCTIKMAISKYIYETRKITINNLFVINNLFCSSKRPHNYIYHKNREKLRNKVLPWIIPWAIKFIVSNILLLYCL